MRIVVTGGGGRLGQAVIEQLLPRGHQVLAIDVQRPASLPCRFLPVDLTRPAEVYDALQGAEAVIHLGAVPGPLVQSPARTFENNVLSTYHVAEAAAALGTGRLVFVSSLFALGWAEEADRYWPQYVPVDEAHPLTPFESYGLSKQVGEDILAAVCRRTGLSAVSLRMTNIVRPDQLEHLPWPRPTPERPVRFALWPYLETRDAARSCVLAVEAATSGHEAYFIAASQIRFDAPTEELLAQFAPATLRRRRPLIGSETVLDVTKAAEQLNFRAEHRWEPGAAP